MAQLLYTKKRAGYEKGDRSEAKIFELGDSLGIKIRAVRKYKNDANDTKFKTVEINANNFNKLLENISSCRQTLIDMLLESRQDSMRKELQIHELQEKIADFEESY